MSDVLQPGNPFVVWKLDRLGHDLKRLVSTVEGLRRRGVGLWVLASVGAEIDTGAANGRLIFTIFAVLAEFERELIVERTRAGLAATRARGRQSGRPRNTDRVMLRMAMSAMAARETNVQSFARRLGVTTTLYRYVNGDGTVKAPGLKLFDLRRRLGELSPRHRGRRALVMGTREFGDRMRAVGLAL